ncbi:Uncharacterized protein TCAP_04148 [Tolypocladium capitatum]|uniref:U1-type domain-containing protein n=1 Tax=Tolypocladium capitatum TaxID=45235 RepID=A0A2K3QEE6_9HYPO|nr:Uncharacterized protein TCAP_04148 [Tolypocladium capitatum]
MSEHWKSTPRYWCKHCSCYVRDTKLEKQNHEATARHQGAIKRSLRDLHRNHEREERDKERARREIERLNGVVSTSSSSPSFNSSAVRSTTTTTTSHATTATESELKRQREQLAALGVAMPSVFRPEMAIPGEWTVTNTRVVESSDGQGDAIATGVRKREETEEQREEEEAVRRLFKKPRRWGRDSKVMPEGEDGELDALLGGTAIPLKTGGGLTVENEDGEDGETVKHEHVKTEAKHEETPIKEEPDAAPGGLTAETKLSEPCRPDSPVKAEEGGADAGPAPVVFKKRKPKGIRTK